MFNMGGGELILVAIVALLFIPPKKLPQAATSLGRFFSQLQRGFNELKSGVQSSLKDDGGRKTEDGGPKTDDT